MIDEASAKMALVIAGKGRAAGLERTNSSARASPDLSGAVPTDQ